MMYIVLVWYVRASVRGVYYFQLFSKQSKWISLQLYMLCACVCVHISAVGGVSILYGVKSNGAPLPSTKRSASINVRSHGFYDYYDDDGVPMRPTKFRCVQFKRQFYHFGILVVAAVIHLLIHMGNQHRHYFYAINILLC